ncbi:Hypothetical protein TPAR_09466 [Tolypocladium paradoxum]|uniref:Uncharacterized protein n=1 Tax=Tolypocladium paradoxum TaxID=94208 RepID=A0A2S4L4M7_9HYPO|nr:Hypothetical protein TPAR_09466 [Tolypocladium paradoxum]
MSCRASAVHGPRAEAIPSKATLRHEKQRHPQPNPAPGVTASCGTLGRGRASADANSRLGRDKSPSGTEHQTTVATSQRLHPAMRKFFPRLEQSIGGGDLGH